MNLSVSFPLVLLLLLTVHLFPKLHSATTRSAPHLARPSALSLFPSPSLHVFFYAWYGAPPHDVGYLHWTHSVLPHWTAAVTDQHRKEPYVAPGDPGVTYFPARGLYSSHDSEVLEAQMAEMKDMGAEVAVVSWWGQKHKNSSMDGQGVGSDHCMPAILDAAEKAGVKVAIHLEPYPLRSEHTVKDDLEYIFDQYGSHPAFYRHPTTNQCLLYAYDSYHMTPQQWQQLLSADGSITIRGTQHDCIVIALVLDSIDDAVHSHFDGVYSYFAATGFTRAANTAQWKGYVAQAAQHSMLFVPSVAPGYDDTRLRPWNGQNKRDRKHGAYYDQMWRAAIDSGASVIAITTYNEWGEGTQIEPARPFITTKGDQLRGYSENDVASGQAGQVLSDGEEYLYVERTKQWLERWQETAASAGQNSQHQDLR